jgi:hypothetical protein
MTIQEMLDQWFADAIAGTKPWDGKLVDVNWQRRLPLRGNQTVVVTVGGNN